MRDLTPVERAKIQAMTDSVARTFKTRRKPTDDQTGNNAELSFSGEARFSDTGTNSGNADFFAPEKAEAALSDIRRIVVKHSVKDSIRQFVLQRNEVSKRNRERRKEKEKAEQNPNVSKPFWY